MIWREKKGWLIALAVLLLANVLFFVTYRVQFEKRLEDVEVRRNHAEDQLAQARATRIAAEQQFARYRKVQADLDTLYNTRWATQNERLTALIREVKKLAEVTKLSPPAYSFSHTEEKEAAQPKSGIGTATVGITFTVQGSYPQLRRLINLLELSPQFVIIDALTVNLGSDSNNLTMSLRLKTLFREPRRVVTAPVNQEM
jgi:hypothetical protein